MKYIVAQWIFWLIGAAAIGGVTGYLLRRPIGMSGGDTTDEPRTSGVDTDTGGTDRQVVEADHADREELLAALDEHEAVLDALYAAVSERDLRIAELEAILGRADADVPGR